MPILFLKLQCENKRKGDFKRLLKGRPEIPKHVGIDTSKITPGIVSVEAGFDGGYLKRSRSSHKALYVRIDASKADFSKKGGNNREQFRRLKNKADQDAESKAIMKQKSDKMLTQNSMLVERIRDLEKKL